MAFVTLKQILSVLESQQIVITEKELAELISHEILAGTSYFKQLNKRDKVLFNKAKEDREYYENLYFAEYYRELYLKLKEQ